MAEEIPVPQTEDSSEQCVLKIFLSNKGAVRVEGCINDKVASFGFLEVAKECISNHHKKLTETKIVKANPFWSRNDGFARFKK